MAEHPSAQRRVFAVVSSLSIGLSITNRIISVTSFSIASHLIPDTDLSFALSNLPCNHSLRTPLDRNRHEVAHPTGPSLALAQQGIDDESGVLQQEESRRQVGSERDSGA